MPQTRAGILLIAALFVAVPAALPSLLAQQKAPQRLTASPVVERDIVAPGSTVDAALVVRVGPPFHIQSNKPRDPYLIPTTLTIEPEAGVTVEQIVFPPATTMRLKDSPDVLDVFEQAFDVGVRLSIGKDRAPGPLKLAARFRYQACDDTVCFRPETLTTGWTFTVAASAAGGKRQHADVFARIKFDQEPGGPGAAAAQSAQSAPRPATTPAPGMAAPGEAPPAAGSAAAETISRGELLKAFDAFAVRGTAGGFMSVAEFRSFVQDAEAGVKQQGWFDNRGWFTILGLVFLGGLALNLTPCVLPMIPVNLAIIGARAAGASRSRGLVLGAAYGAGIAIVYGLLGAIITATAGQFGTINASPWFNFGIAALFIVLGLAMFDVLFIDFSKWAGVSQVDESRRGTLYLAFSMGAIAALLAGACVAPVVIQVIVFAGERYTNGSAVALLLPFVLGLGMALPWPFAGAGIAALPRPGAWMVRVKQAMGVFILGMAGYYAWIGYGILASRFVDPSEVKASVEAQLQEGWHADVLAGLQEAERLGQPVLIDFWATWCKNCLVMDKTTFKDPEVRKALANYTKIKFQAEDPGAPPASDVLDRLNAVGLPWYVILQPRSAARSSGTQ